MEFFAKLFDTSDFPPRWHCGHWTSEHGWLHILSDIAIWGAYFSIPCMLWFIAARKRPFPYRGVLALFGAFILLCGTTHLMEAIIFWWPAYRLAGLLKFATAVVSCATVAALVKIAPSAFAMRSPTELEQEIKLRTVELTKIIAALDAERNWFKTTLACIGDAVIATDGGATISNMNGMAEKLTGWTEVEAKGKALADVFHVVGEQTRRTLDNPAFRALKHGVTVGKGNQTLLLSRDGAERNIDDSAAPIKDASGEVIGAVLVFRDITAKAQADRELQNQLELTRTITSTLSTAVIIVDNQMRCTFANPAAERMSGFSFTEMRGLPLSETGFSTTVSANGINQLSVQSTFSRELVARRKNGEAYPVRVNAQPLLQGERQAGTVIEIRDLTSEKQAAMQLKQSANEFRQLANAMPQIVWASRPDGTLDYFNDRWYEFTGFDRQLVGDPSWLPIVHPEDLEKSRSVWYEAVRSGAPFQIECRLKDPRTNSFRWYLGRALAARDRHGEVARWFGSFTDIDETKRTQVELRRVAAQLSEADRRKDEFLAVLAHELRNPLAPIRTGLEVIKLSEFNSTTTREIHGTLERQVTQLVTLVDDLLDVSRITRGKLELRKCDSLTDDVIQSAVEASMPLINAAGHTLHLEPLDQPLRILGDPHRIAQMISNLLNNAAKYTPEGGNIWLSVSVDNGNAVFRVRDTGVGIPSGRTDYIFEMFSQIEDGTQNSKAGLGIGLTLVKTLVTMHGGTIAVESPGLNLGSTFTVTLPIGTVSEEPQKFVPQVEQSVPAQLKVIVADDNKAAAGMLALILKMQGHEVRVCNDGLEAVSEAQRFEPDVVLMDIGMPNLDGYGAARKIRSETWGKSILLVALTGWGQQEDRQKTHDAGFDHHLVKPADPADIQRILASANRRHP